jgi:hypothetical protein
MALNTVNKIGYLESANAVTIENLAGVLISIVINLEAPLNLQGHFFSLPGKVKQVRYQQCQFQPKAKTYAIRIK